MSWLNFDSVKDNVSSLTGQISTFTREVLTEGTEEVYDNDVELKIARGKVSELESRLNIQKAELDRSARLNEELQEKSDSSELQIRSLTTEYRHQLTEKDNTIKELEQSFSESQRTSFSRTRNDSSSKDQTDIEDVEFLQHQLANLKHKITSLETESQRWRDAASSNTAEAELQHIQEQHHQEIASLQDSYSEKIHKLKQKHRSDIDLLEREKTELEEQVKELQEFNNWDDGQDGQKDSLPQDSLKSELAKQNSIISELEERCNKAESNFIKAKDNCLELDVELEATQEKLDDLNQFNNELALKVLNLEKLLGNDSNVKPGKQEEDVVMEQDDGECRRSSDASTTGSRESDFVKVDNIDRYHDFSCQVTPAVDSDSVVKELDVVKDENISLALEINRLRNTDDNTSIDKDDITFTEESNGATELQNLRGEIDRLASCITDLLEELDYSKETQREQAIELDCLRHICLIEGEPFDELKALHVALTELGERYADLLQYYRQVRIELHESNERLLSEMQRNHNNTLLLHQEVNDIRANVTKSIDSAIEKVTSDQMNLNNEIDDVSQGVLYQQDNVIQSLEEKSRDCKDTMMKVCMSDSSNQIELEPSQNTIVDGLREEKAILERTIEGLERKMELLQGQSDDTHHDSPRPDSESPASHPNPILHDEYSITQEGLVYDDDDQQPCDSQWQNDQSRIEELEMISLQYEEEIKRNESVQLDWEVEKEALEAAVVSLQHKCKELQISNKIPILSDQAVSTDVDSDESKCKTVDFRSIKDILNWLLNDLSINEDGLLDFLDSDPSNLETFSQQMQQPIKLIYDSVCKVVKNADAMKQSLTEQCSRLSLQNGEANEIIAQMNEQLNILSSELNMKNDELNAIKLNLDSHKNIISDRENELNELKLELERVNGEYQSTLNRVETAENEILNLAESNETLQQDYDSTSQTNVSLTQEKEQLQSELDNVQFQIDTNETDDSSEIGELKAQLSDMKNERENMVSMINERDTNILELQDRYDNIIAKLEEDHSQDVKMLENDKEAMLNTFEKEKSSYYEMQTLLKSKDEQCEMLLAKITDVESNFTDNESVNTKDDILKLDADALHNIEQENKSLKFRIADMEEKLIGIAHNEIINATSEEEKETHKEVEQLMDVIRRKDEQLISLQSESHDFETTQQSERLLQDNIQQISFMEEKQESLEELVKHYSSQVDLLKDEQQKSQQVLQEKIEELNDLKDKFENVSSRAEAKVHASSLLHSEHQRLLELNNSQGDEIARLREKIHHLQQTLEERQMEHGTQKQMAGEVTQLMAQIAALQDDEERLLGVLHDKEASIRSVRGELDSMEIKYNEAMVTIKGLEESTNKTFSHLDNTPDFNSLKIKYEDAMATIMRLEETLSKTPSSRGNEVQLDSNEAKSQEAPLKFKRLETAIEAMPNFKKVENVYSEAEPMMMDIDIIQQEEATFTEVTPAEDSSSKTSSQFTNVNQVEIDNLSIKLQELEHQLTSTKFDHEAELKNLHCGFEDSIQGKDAELKSLEGKLVSSEDACKRLNDTLQQNGVNIEQLDLLNQEIENTNNLLNTKENEMIALKINLSKLQSVVNASEAALSKIQDDNQQLQKECQQKDEIISTLQKACTKHEQTLRQNENEIHHYKVKSLEAEAKATQETQRLRNHLLEIEDAYTKEALLAQQREEELQEKFNNNYAELQRTSVLLQQTSQTSHDGMHSLEDQLHVMASQRDNALLQLSKADDKAEESTAALANLQFALEQLQKDKDGRYDLLNEQYEKLSQKSKKDQDEIKRKEAECQARMQEAAFAVQGAQNLKADLKMKIDTLGQLQEEVNQLKHDTSTKDELLRRLKDSSDGKVDKPLIKNLLIGYFHAPETKRSDVVRVIGSLVGFSTDEIHSIGSGAPPSSLAGGWISGILSRGSQPNNRQSRGNDSILDPQNQSFSEMFVSFLEHESINSSTVPKQNKSNPLISASMVTPSSRPPMIPSFSLHNASSHNQSVNGASATSLSGQGGQRMPVLFPAPGQDIPRVHTSTANSALQSMLS